MVPGIYDSTLADESVGVTTEVAYRCKKFWPGKMDCSLVPVRGRMFSPPSVWREHCRLALWW